MSVVSRSIVFKSLSQTAPSRLSIAERAWTTRRVTGLDQSSDFAVPLLLWSGALIHSLTNCRWPFAGFGSTQALYLELFYAHERF